ncbi:response regulator transcription factor [Kitasatospora sp. GP82]|uniref:response regulator transcription factor n=1 Tax=Kitasatospora sp. GP82 TaxID=3035089 RepID=UPI002474BD6B|nr:response regulator transcription factor [Kitasatospora sp. GP82]MDH6128388.1 DNA-binding NarL/FixJ family response regulator [Kitasatospora sp. GP82]
MLQTHERPTETARITVEVHAPDPISRAGAVSQLRPHPEIDLIGEGPQSPGAAVAVVLSDTTDAATLLQLRGLARGGAARVVLVVGRIREPELMDVLECGVSAILWRHEAGPERLRRAVLAAARGQGDLPADLLGRLLDQVGRMQRNAGDSTCHVPTGLAARETDILRLIADGLDTAEIGASLGYSERTVKNVLHGLTTRLHLRNRAHAVAYALREGFI